MLLFWGRGEDGVVIAERVMTGMARTVVVERVIAGTIMAERVVAAVKCAGWQELSV